MPKFPEPPRQSFSDLGISPIQYILTKGTLLWRVYFRRGRHPTLWNQFRSYGPTPRGRFDHHLPPPGSHHDRNILYAATFGPTAMAEVFQESRTIDRQAREPWLVAFELARDMTLLDLSGNWPTLAGASMALNSGPRPRAQRWSRKIYEEYPGMEGLWHPSSMFGNKPCVVLYERGVSAIPPYPSFHRPLNDPGLLQLIRNAAHDIGYILI